MVDEAFPSLSQNTVGWGSPSATHLNVAELPSLAIRSAGSWMILGLAGKNNTRKLIFLFSPISSYSGLQAVDFQGEADINAWKMSLEASWRAEMYYGIERLTLITANVHCCLLFKKLMCRTYEATHFQFFQLIKSAGPPEKNTSLLLLTTKNKFSRVTWFLLFSQM